MCEIMTDRSLVCLLVFVFHVEMASHSWRKWSSQDQENELLVFGYSAKLFRDDVRAQEIEEGSGLIPWMGNQEVMIDRSVS